MARLAAAQQPAPNPEVPVRQAREAIALARARTATPRRCWPRSTAPARPSVDYAPAEERLSLARELTALALPRGELTIGQQAYARMAVDCLELGALGEAEIAIAALERLGQALGHPRWRWRGALLARDAGAAGRPLAGAGPRPVRGRAADRRGRRRRRGGGRCGSTGSCALREREAGGVQELAALEHPALAQVEYTANILPLVRASILARMGELAAARRGLEALPADLTALAADPLPLSLLCDTVALVGDPVRAAWLLPRLARYEGRNLSFGLYGLVWDGPVALLEGGLRLVLGQWADAIAPLEESLAVAAALGARPLAARTSSQLATALWHRDGPGGGDRQRAEALYERAREEARTLGMDHLLARIEAGHPTRRPPSTGSPAPPPPAAPAPPAAPPAAITLVREGDIWSIAWGGEETRLKHARGLEILAQLVNNPGRSFHVLSLGAAEPGEVIDTGDAGELLDEDARQAYRRRIAELGQELEEAAAWADAARRDRLRAEREFLQEELARAVGLGGRARRAGAAVERARSNVQKRLRAVIRKLAETAPALAHHLDSEIKTGTHVTYRRPIAG